MLEGVYQRIQKLEEGVRGLTLGLEVVALSQRVTNHRITCSQCRSATSECSALTGLLKELAAIRDRAEEELE